MRKVLYIVVACLLLLAIAAVFVAPGVDLEPTAMRAARAATAAMAALAAIASGVLTPLVLTPQEFVLTPVIPHRNGNFPDLIDVFCTRLC